MFLQSSIYVPNVGMFDSQAGNIIFPVWESLFALMGMGFEVEEEPANT